MSMSVLTEWKELMRERDEALLTLNREKLMVYMGKFDYPVPENEEVFWAGAHKARLGLFFLPVEEKECSVKWLLEHGFTPDIFGLPPESFYES